MTADGEGLDTGPFSLSSVKPGYYFVDISLVNENNQKLATARENLILLSQAYSVVPWVYAKTHQPFPNPGFLFALSTEYFMTKQYEKDAKGQYPSTAIEDIHVVRKIKEK